MTDEIPSPVSPNAFPIDYARGQIRFKAAQLLRRRDMRTEFRDDIEQELWLIFCSRVASYDPNKASFDTFTQRVLYTAVGELLRRRHRRRRRPDRPIRSLDSRNDDRELHEMVSRSDLDRRTGGDERNPLEAIDRSEAIHAALAAMRPELRAIAQTLMESSDFETAKRQKISRWRLAILKGEIRDHLRRFGLEFS